MLTAEDGYVKFYRNISQWPWYHDADTLRLFIHCILKANYEEQKWHRETIPVGSFVTSYGELAGELKLSKEKIRTALNHLKQTRDAAQRNKGRSTIITLNNYSDYLPQNTDDDSPEEYIEGIQGAH